MPPLDADRAVARLMRLLAVEGVTGQEKAIAAEVVRALKEAGVPRRRFASTMPTQRIPLPTQTGNLLVALPGTRPGPPLLFMTHLDTVPLCAGAVPVRVSKDRIAAKGATALGGDNRTGVAALVTLAATLLEHKLPHPPLTLLFTVREESGLFGARHVDPADLGGVAMGFNIDGGSASDLTIGAVGAERWEVEITGKASHAGVHPEQGISRDAGGGAGLERGPRRRLVRQGPSGRARGYVQRRHLRRPRGQERRRRDQRGDRLRLRPRRIAQPRSEVFQGDHKGVRDGIQARRDEGARRSGPQGEGEVRIAAGLLPLSPEGIGAGGASMREAAAVSLGMEPKLRVGNGGLDANWLVQHGIPTVTFGAGQNEIHTVKEWVDVPKFLAGCRMALAAATLH